MEGRWRCLGCSRVGKMAEVRPRRRDGGGVAVAAMARGWHGLGTGEGSKRQMRTGVLFFFQRTVFSFVYGLRVEFLEMGDCFAKLPRR